MINGFSGLNSTAAGRQVLQQNLAGSIAINNNSTTAQRGQAVVDNTIGSLIGGLNNGIMVSDGLGSNLNAVFNTKNSAAANFSFTGLSANYTNLMGQLNTLITGGDSAVAKNFFANGTRNGTVAANGISLPAGGIFNVYDAAYNPLPGNKNKVGDTRPYAVAPGQIQTFTANDYFGVSTNTATAILPTLNSNASFPSGHSTAGFASSQLLAMMVPERYQQEILRGAEFGNSRIVLGAHYELDVIGARIQTYFALTQALNNNANYTNQTVPGLLGGSITTTGDFKALFASATADTRALLGTCTGGIAACAASSATDRFSDRAASKAQFNQWLTYGLTATGPTNLDAVVPVGAEVLIASRFPYLSSAQQRDVLASTEIASGQALDNGTGYARLNLYNAADGYGSFNGTINVTLDASKGGFNAYDTWRNDIADYKAPSTGAVTQGSLVKNGSGTLELAGNNSWTGSTTVNGGALIFSGTSNLKGALINNSVVSTTLQDGTAGRSLTVGTYTGGAGSQLALGAQLGGAGSKGDTLNITGGITAGTSTSIVVSDSAPTTAAGYNPAGIVLVNVAKGQTALATNFSLAGGTIHKGLFDYNLVYNADPQFILVSLPGADAYRLAALATGAHNIWFDTAAVVDDRMSERRDQLSAGGAVPGGPAWAKVFGSWTSRDQTSSIASYSSTVSVDSSYKQTTDGVIGGFDGGMRGVLGANDTLIVGVNAGYVTSEQKFSNSSTRANYDGGLLGASATYMSGNFFLDAAFKADLLQLDVAVPSAAAFGAAKASGHARTVGVTGDAGYRLALGATMFAEPSVTLAYANANIDSLALAGSTVTFQGTDALRGRVGLRVGGTLSEQEAYRLTLVANAGYWHLLSGDASATFNSGASSPLLTISDKQIEDFGEVGLSLNYLSLKSGWSAFAKGNYQFGSNYESGTIEGGLRYNF